MQGNRIEIVIDTQAQGDASAELTRLRQTLDSIRQAQANLQSTTFNAFSRAQIQPQIAALDELAARVRKVATEMQVLSQTVQPATGLQSIINTAVGADRAITSAAASARILRTSLSAAAEADNRLQQATEAQRRSVEQLAEARARAFARPASQMPELPPPVIRAAPVIREIEADVDRLAKRLTQLQQLQTAGFGQLSQGFAASAPGIRSLSEQIEEAHGRLNDLIAFGAQGQSQELQGILGAEAARERNEINQKLIADSVRMVAAEKAVTAAVREGNQAQLERLRNANIARIAARPQVETTQQTIERTTGVSQSAFSAEQIEEMTKAWPQMGRAAGDALGRTRYLLGLNRIGFLELQAAGVNTFQALASGMNPFHVAVMESSQVLGALIQGGLLPFKSVWAAAASPIGLTVGAVTAASAALGLVTYRAFQAGEAVRSVQVSFQMLGQGSQAFAQRPIISAERSRLSAQFGESLFSSDINTITSAFNATSGSMSEYRSRLHDLVIAQAAFGQQDISTSAEMLGKAAEGGAAGLLKLTEQLDINGPAWRENVQRMIETGNEGQAINEILTAMEGRWGNAGKAASTNIDSMQTSWERLKASFSVGPSAFWEYLTTGRGPPDVSKMLPAIPPAIRAGERVSIQLAPEEEQRALIQERFNTLKRAELETTRQIVQTTKSVSGGVTTFEASIPAANQVTQATERYKQALDNLASTEAPRSAAAEHNFRIQVASLHTLIEQTEQAAAKDSALWTRVAELRQQLADLTTQHIKGALDQEGEAYRRISEESIRLAQDAANARRRVVREALEQRSYESEFRVAQRPADTQLAVVEAQRRLNDLLKDETSDRREIQSLTTQILGLQNQLASTEFQANSARLQQAEIFAQARGDLAAIVDLRRQEAAIVSGRRDRGQATDADVVRADNQAIQSQVQSEQKSVQLRQQMTEQANQFATNRSQTNIAALNLEVTQYDITKTQAIQAEMGLTRSVMEQNQTRLRSLLQTQGLTVDQRAQINTQLASLYEEDAQKQIELQGRLTESIRAENERRLSYMKNFFDQAGSSAADVLIAGITKSQTRTEALQGFARSIVSSFIKEASSAASQFAGGRLASMLGVKVDPSGDTGIGTVLSKWIGNQLGLTKDEPKVDQAAISEKMRLAGDTQKTAADLMLQAAQTFAQAAQAGPYKGGAGLPEALKAQTSPEVVKPYSPSVPTDYGAPGEYGAGQANKAAIVLVEPLSSSSARSVSNLPAPRPSAWMGDPATSGLRNIPGLDAQAQISAFNQLKADIQAGTEAGTKAGISNAPIKIEPLSNLTQDMTAQTQATQQAVQQTQQGTQAETENSTSVKELTQVMREQSQQKQMPSSLTSEQARTGESGTSLGSWSSRPASTSSGGLFSGQSLNLFTQGLGLAATAASLFGRNLSTTARTILGGIGAISQLMNFSKTLGSVFGAVGDASKGVSGTMTLLQTANTANTLSTTLNTTATYANSTAQTTAAASSAGGSALGGIGTLFKAIPFIGGLFERGGIVPSAAGGMIVSSMGGGSGQLGILHPREMVLPARLSEGVQNLINTGSPASTQSNTTNAPIFNYEANVTGYHPYESRRQFESMLRNHGATMQEWVENSLRNGMFKPA